MRPVSPRAIAVFILLVSLIVSAPAGAAPEGQSGPYEDVKVKTR